jgi:hypothetical protein
MLFMVPQHWFTSSLIFFLVFSYFVNFKKFDRALLKGVSFTDCALIRGNPSVVLEGYEVIYPYGIINVKC